MKRTKNGDQIMSSRFLANDLFLRTLEIKKKLCDSRILMNIKRNKMVWVYIKSLLIFQSTLP